MGFEKEFSDIGVSVLHASVPADVLAYLTERGHTSKGIKEANFRYVEGDQVTHMFPASSVGMDTAKSKECWSPLRAVVLPYPGAAYAVARIWYDVRRDGGGDGPKKFLGLKGEVPLYIPLSVTKKSLLDPDKSLYVIESPFKAVAAAAHGVACIGVNGHTGAFETETHRAKLRADLRDYLKKGREVSLLTDADVRGNLEVRESLLAFMDIAEKGYGCKAMWVDLPDLGDGKSGIDDYFAAKHSLKDFNKLPRYSSGSAKITELKCAFFARTELGLAHRFEAQHGHDCRHDPDAQTWYTWTARGYGEGIVEPHARIIQTIATLDYETAAAKLPGDRAERIKFAKESARRHVQDSAITLAGRLPTMRIDASAFDADSNMLGVKNGIYDLRAGKLQQPSRKLMVTKATGCKFDAKAKAPMFQRFIYTAANGDKDLRRHIQEIVGASLLGRSMRTQLHIIYGPPQTGKSVLIEVGLALLGDYGMASKADLLLRQRRNNDPEAPTPFLKTLRGRRLVVCSELNEGVAFDDALIKDLTGGDTITARGLNEAPVTFKNTATIWIRGNHLPVIGADAAMRDRVIVTPLEHIVEERDKTLADRIISTELSGVLNWALVGMRRYVERGCEFQLPECVKNVTTQMQRDGDVIGQWLSDCIKVDPSKRMDVGDFVDSYRIWCAKNGHLHPKSSTSLYKDLRRRYKLSDKWPLKSDGQVFAVGFGPIKEVEVPNAVESLIAANRDLADQNQELQRKLAVLTAANVVPFGARRKRAQ